MMKCFRMILLTLCFLSVAKLTLGARILAIIPTPSYSHQVVYRSLWAALSERGHEVVVITTDPVHNQTLTNLTEIDLRNNYKYLTPNFVEMRYENTWTDMLQDMLWGIGLDIAENVFNNSEVKKLYAPNNRQKFDVVICEMIFITTPYIFAHLYNAPLIGVSSLGVYNSHHYEMGGPILPSHHSSWEVEGRLDFNVTFWQRLKNFLKIWRFIYAYWYNFTDRQQRLLEKYFGKDIPNIWELERNISLVLINQHPALSFVRPNAPNVITFGGFHVSKNPKPLTGELKRVIDSAPNGFIYVSLGTNARGKLFPKEVQRTFLEVFAKLPYKVLWKFEDKLPNKTDNVYNAEWFPQQSVLAHPNIKLFIYQGGMQSTEEAVNYAVPLVVIPVLADQDHQANRMESLRVARRLELCDLNTNNFYDAIIDVLTDKGYKERMVQLRNLVNDKPYDYLENAVWWIEFVIRHRGAPHLRCSIADLPWYQRYDTDVIAFLSVVMFIAIVSASLIIWKVSTVLIARYTQHMSDMGKKKKNN